MRTHSADARMTRAAISAHLIAIDLLRQAEDWGIFRHRLLGRGHAFRLVHAHLQVNDLRTAGSLPVGPPHEFGERFGQFIGQGHCAH